MGQSGSVDGFKVSHIPSFSNLSAAADISFWPKRDAIPCGQSCACFLNGGLSLKNDLTALFSIVFLQLGKGLDDGDHADAPGSACGEQHLQGLDLGDSPNLIPVFKLIQDLLAPSPVKGKNQFQLLMQKLPPEHKAKWFAGAALNTADHFPPCSSAMDSISR